MPDLPNIPRAGRPGLSNIDPSVSLYATNRETGHVPETARLLDGKPYLIVRDAESTLRFLAAVFSATRLRVHPRPGGQGIEHAEARIEDTMIMMGEIPDAVEASVHAHVHVYVADAEATFAKAVAAGGRIVQELRRSGDGDYRGGIADGNGVVWWISQQDQFPG